MIYSLFNTLYIPIKQRIVYAINGISILSVFGIKNNAIIPINTIIDSIVVNSTCNSLITIVNTFVFMSFIFFIGCLKG